MDNEYCVWSFQGRLIRKHKLDRFCQLLWRPRPPTLLSEAKLKEIRKNLKQYSAQFEVKDRMMMSKVSKDILENRKRLMKEFRDYRERCKEQSEEKRARLMELRGIDEHDNEGVEEEVIEFFLREEVLDTEE